MNEQMPQKTVSKFEEIVAQLVSELKKIDDRIAEKQQEIDDLQRQKKDNLRLVGKFVEEPKSSMEPLPLTKPKKRKSSGKRLDWDTVLSEFAKFIGEKSFKTTDLMDWIKENKGKEIQQSQAGSLLKKSESFKSAGQEGKSKLFKVK